MITCRGKYVRSMELCKGRHDIPAAEDGAIFPQNVNPINTGCLERMAEASLCKGKHTDELILYVTGLSVALVAVINVCRRHKIKLILMHYDRESGNYYSQEVEP